MWNKIKSIQFSVFTLYELKKGLVFVVNVPFVASSLFKLQLQPKPKQINFVFRIRFLVTSWCKEANKICITNKYIFSFLGFWKNTENWYGQNLERPSEMSENQVQNTVAAPIIGEQSTWKFEKTSNKTFLKKSN